MELSAGSIGAACLWRLDGHGARFPNKRYAKDLAWPNSDQFWEDYSGNLSPEGCEQLRQLGRMLNARYVSEESECSLFRDMEDPRFAGKYRYIAYDPSPSK